MKNGEPVCDAWLWLDSRSSDIAKKLTNLASEEMRFIATGTGMFQSSQLLFMETHHPEILDKAKTAFHCKDWIYYKLTELRLLIHQSLVLLLVILEHRTMMIM